MRLVVARLVVMVLAVVMWVGPTSAAPFRDGMVIIGDSLSDTGHFSQLTAGAVPGSGYEQGRFSNGPVWVEHVAAGLGHAPPMPAPAGGTNFAFGAAQTVDGIPLDPDFDMVDMDQQVDLYLQHLSSRPGRPPRHDLFVVWGGANDFMLAGQTDPVSSAQNIGQHIEALYDAGGRNFLVGNLPLLGEVPDVRDDPVARAGLNALAMGFNAALAQVLADLEQALPGLSLFHLDAAELFDEIWADPAAHGIVNTTDPAVPGLAPGLVPGEGDVGQPVEDAELYMFWDGVHPSALTHELIGERALTSLDGLGPAGWYHQQALGEASTPEPGTAALVGVLGGWLLLRRRRPACHGA